MKTYVKSISVKASDLMRKDSESTLPCKKCKEECKVATCDVLQAWVNRCDKYAVEWDICHDGLEVSRMICKTVIWLAFVCAFTYIAIKVFK